MEFAANFTAIDFETATRRSDSACQLAAVVVRDGKVADSHMWMIRPQPNRFHPFNVQIHGITERRVADEPTFGELWSEMAPILCDDCLVAHNAKFDIGVLLACLNTNRIPIPELQFTCTRAVARRTWPGRSGYGLKKLADWMGVQFRHHDALEDSIACAKILLAAGIDRQAKTLEGLEQSLRLGRGAAGQWGQRGPGQSKASKKRRSARRRPALSRSFPTPNDVDSQFAVRETTPSPTQEIDMQRLMIRAEFIRPLAGQRIAFAGRLERLTAEQAERLARQLGGECLDITATELDVLVVGATESDRPREDEASNRRDIRSMTEREFLGLVGYTDEE